MHRLTNKPLSLWAPLQTYSESLVLKIHDLSAVYQFVRKGDGLEKDFAGCGEGLEGVERRSKCLVQGTSRVPACEAVTPLPTP